MCILKRLEFCIPFDIVLFQRTVTVNVVPYNKWQCPLTEGFEPASMISQFEDEEEQKIVAALFNTKISGLDGRPIEMDSKQDREHALRDIVIKVKENSYEYYSKNLASDVNALNEVIQGKKQLEKLRKTNIELEK